MNILCISTFSMLSLFNIEYLNENYVRPLLISYFVIDSYKNKPDIIIILAWHLFDPIYQKWKKIGLKKSKYVKLLPKLVIK